GFQKKCLGKMGDVAKQGRTVLFVTHNMSAVRNLCSRAVLLADGRVVEDTYDLPHAIGLYNGINESTSEWYPEPARHTDEMPLVFTRIKSELLGHQPNHT